MHMLQSIDAARHTNQEKSSPMGGRWKVKIPFLCQSESIHYLITISTVSQSVSKSVPLFPFLSYSPSSFYEAVNSELLLYKANN